MKEMKTWLFNYVFMPKNYLNFLTIVPADRSRKLANFDEVRDKSFHVVNGQHTLAAYLEYVNDPSNAEEVKEIFFKWPCNVVWAREGDDDPLFHLSGVLNLGSEYKKHFTSWVKCIQHAKKTWIRRERPARTMREKSSNSEAFKKWKVFFYTYLLIQYNVSINYYVCNNDLESVMEVAPTGIRLWESGLSDLDMVIDMIWISYFCISFFDVHFAGFLDLPIVDLSCGERVQFDYGARLPCVE